MIQKKAESIQFIMNSQLGGVLSKAFAQLYRAKPDFPITYLGKWLKQYSQLQKKKQHKSQQVNRNVFNLKKLQGQQQKKIQKSNELKNKQRQKQNKYQRQFDQKISTHQYLEDLLRKQLPNYLEKQFKLSGVYVGYLTYRHRFFQPNNFQAGAQLDTDNPKVIEYIGASDSQDKTMFMQILPSQNGVSYDCFKQPQPEPEEQQPAEGEQPRPPKPPKKTYIYIPDVTKNQRMHYFKFPKLGSFACFPLKLNSLLGQQSFNQGVIEYKQYIKQKQQTEKQYQDKLNQTKNQLEQARKKYQELQIPEEDVTPEQQTQKQTKQQQLNKLQQTYKQLQTNPPIIKQPTFNCQQKCYCVGCDTLGQDKQISVQVLDQIDKKLAYFKKIFQSKQRNMLLHDINAYIQQQSKFEAIQNIYKQLNEKIQNSLKQQQQKQNHTKQSQYEYEITKAKKINILFDENIILKSMKIYFQYNIPKYKDIYQIGLMLLKYHKQDINISRTNLLDWRKVKDQQFVSNFIQKFQQFDLKPLNAPPCPQQYKINKLLQRLQKIDLQQVSKYNGFIWILALQIKSYCWALILCRDAKKQAYEQSVKAKQDRDAEIQKYLQQRQKAMTAAREEVEAAWRAEQQASGKLSSEPAMKTEQDAEDEENQQNKEKQQKQQKENEVQKSQEKEKEKQKQIFNQQEWINNYLVDNPEPQPLEAIALQEYLNID